MIYIDIYFGPFVFFSFQKYLQLKNLFHAACKSYREILTSVQARMFHEKQDSQ